MAHFAIWLQTQLCGGQLGKLEVRLDLPTLVLVCELVFELGVRHPIDSLARLQSLWRKLAAAQSAQPGYRAYVHCLGVGWQVGCCLRLLIVVGFRFGKLHRLMGKKLGLILLPCGL